MKLFTILAFIFITNSYAHGALNLELRSVLDIKRSGGTAVGSFDTQLGDDGPNFQLGVTGRTTFNIRNNGGGADGDWEWRTSGVLENSTTVVIPDTTIWSSGVVPIDDSPLLSNADRFAPDSVGYLIGRWNSDYYAFRFGIWSDRERLRLYGVETADITILSSIPGGGLEEGIIPEPSSFALFMGIVGIAYLCVSRPRRQRT
jgi:hypothetical protein